MKSDTPLYNAVSSFLDSSLPYSVRPTLDSFTRWKQAVSPMSTDFAVVTAMASYLFIIFTGREIMRDLKPRKFRFLFMLHNALLSSASGLLLFLMLEEIVPIIWNQGFYAAICARSSWTQTFYIINYLFKYWEFADTLFLVVKKKPLQFLHVFHHTATALLCYTQLNGYTSVSWVPITLNLTVHVLMYYYYFITTLSPGIKLWWKKYLTTLQISQFLIDLVVIYFATYSYFASTYGRGTFPVLGSCAGSESAAVFGCAILTSYLFLFVAFYRKTYKSEKKAKSAAKAARLTATGAGPSSGAKLD